MNKHKIIKGIIRKDSSGKPKYICCICLKSGKGSNPCGISNHLIMRVSYKIHFPSATASKTRWGETFKAIGWFDYYNNNGYSSDFDLERKNKMKVLFHTLKIDI